MGRTKSNIKFLDGCQVFDTAGTKLNIVSQSAGGRYWIDSDGECFSPQSLEVQPKVIARSRGFIKVAGEAGWQRNGGRRL